MKYLPLILWCGVLTLLQCDSSKEDAVQSSKPNIIFLFADDMTHSAIHALGNEEIKTPHLDRMVRKGTTFTNTYNMGGWNGAICVASRAMIISGRSIWRANEFRKNWGNKDSSSYQKSWGKLMEGAGYNTYMTGKWHVNAPAEQIFQQVKHIRPGMPPDAWRGKDIARKVREEVGKQGTDGRMVTLDDVMPIGYNRPKENKEDYWSASDPKHGGFWEGGKHWSEVLKDDAIAYIDDAKDNENPFFMYLAFNAPHDPRQAPQEYLDLYSVDEIALPQSWQPEYPKKELIGNGADLRDEALAPFPRTEYATKTHIKEYYAIISHLDAQVGKILDALEASGEMENTYIFFSADHGLAVGKHGLLGKQTLYDHSIRPPLLMMGPDIPEGQKVTNDVYLQDIMATTLEIAGIEKPGYVEFQSFLDQAKGLRKEGHYKQIYGAYTNTQRMIRKDGYKLIVYPRANEILLFNLENDPEEMHNLALEDDQQERVKQLFSELRQLQKEMDDELVLEVDFQ